MRYSNIDPDHDCSTESRPTGVNGRPSRNQCCTGTSPLAIAMKLMRRASEARRSYRAESRLPSATRYPIANNIRVGSNKNPNSIVATISRVVAEILARRSSNAVAADAERSTLLTNASMARSEAGVAVPLNSIVNRRAARSRIASAQRLGNSASDARAVSASAIGSVAGSSRWPAHGISVSRSRACVSTADCSASAHTCSADSGGSARAVPRFRAQFSATRDADSSSANRSAHSAGVRGLCATTVNTTSSASSSRCISAAPTVRSRSDAWAACCSRNAASSMPPSIAKPMTPWAVISRHALPKVMRAPARLPLSTDDT